MFSETAINQIFGLLDCLIFFSPTFHLSDFLLYFQEIFNPTEVVSAIISTYSLIIPFFYITLPSFMEVLSSPISLRILIIIHFYFSYCLLQEVLPSILEPVLEHELACFLLGTTLSRHLYLAFPVLLIPSSTLHLPKIVCL